MQGSLKKFCSAEIREKEEKETAKYLLPNVLFMKHAGQVTAPVASRPPCTLLQEFGVVFEGSLNFGLGMVLHERFPAVRNHPTSDEVVVVRIQLVFTKPPFLVGESVSEHFILKDLGPIGNAASGHARKATIDMRRRCTIKVPSLQVQSPEEVVDALRECWGSRTAQTLAGDHTTVPLILFERGQDPRHNSARPTHIVIGEHGDGRPDFWDSTSHLAALVGMSDGKETDSRLGGRH